MLTTTYYILHKSIFTYIFGYQLITDSHLSHPYSISVAELEDSASVAHDSMQASGCWDVVLSCGNRLAQWRYRPTVVAAYIKPLKTDIRKQV